MILFTAQYLNSLTLRPQPRALRQKEHREGVTQPQIISISFHT